MANIPIELWHMMSSFWWSISKSSHDWKNSNAVSYLIKHTAEVFLAESD